LPWIKVCDLKSLSSGEIMEFNYEKKILLVKIGDQIAEICTMLVDLSLAIQIKKAVHVLHMSAFKKGKLKIYAEYL
jgi:hypothetical protein